MNNNLISQSDEFNHTDQLLWSKLKESNVVQGEMPESNTNDTPWYIRTMQGFAGWIAAFFLLGFFGTMFGWIFDRESAVVAITIGLMGNVAAYVIFNIDHKNEFVHQLGLVLNLCGQLMVAWGIYKILHSFGADFFLALFIYQVILVIILSDFTSRILTTWFAMVALFACFGRIGIFNISVVIASIMFTLVWMNDLQWKKFKYFWEPVGYGLALSLLQFNGQLLFEGGANWLYESNNVSQINQYSYWISKVLIVAIFVNILITLARQYEIKLQSKAGLLIGVSGVLLVAMSYFIVGTSGALLLLIIGFMKQRRLLVTLGIAALLGFISWYYYHLGVTLLTKSIILIGFGICFLVGFYFLNLLSGGKSISFDNLQEKYRMTSNRWIAVGSMILILVLVNVNIYKKEQIIDNGQIVLLKLAPVDPRSLMQGDYMRLRFEIESTLLSKNSDDSKAKTYENGYFVVNLDKNKVGQFSHVDQNKLLEASQVKMQFRVRHRRIRLATHAFFFQEGTASEYEKARYGEFRVAENGELLLNNLRDESFNILGFNRPSN